MFPRKFIVDIRHEFTLETVGYADAFALVFSLLSSFAALIYCDPDGASLQRERRCDFALSMRRAHRLQFGVVLALEIQSSHDQEGVVSDSNSVVDCPWIVNDSR